MMIAEGLVAVIGAKGNMGQRYCAILRHLKVKYVEIDVDNHDWDPCTTHILIATPTDTHFELIKFYADFKLPILCEKPITKNEAELAILLKLEVKLQMINQYRHHKYCQHKGTKTKYDYFKTGTDGMLWDCINIIGLAEGELKIKNESPIWKCCINGYKLDLSMMDEMYINHIIEWLQGNHDNKTYIEFAHRKVLKMLGDK